MRNGIEFVCGYCKKDGKKRPSEYNRSGFNFCDQKCYSEFRKKRDKKACPECKKRFVVRMSEYNRRKYCSRECVLKARTKGANDNVASQS